MNYKMAETISWERKLEFYKKPIVFTWESLLFSGKKRIHGLSMWLAVNALCILLHLNTHTVFHFLGVTFILGGTAGLLFLRFPGSLFANSEWGDNQELLYQEVCGLLRKREAEMKWAMKVFFRYREEEPVKFYLAVLAVLFVCQATIAHLPFTLFIHGLCKWHILGTAYIPLRICYKLFSYSVYN
jgi:hypothetical protein